MKNKLLNAFVIALIMFQAVAPIGALAWVGTDQADYAPGSVVTISGDNSDGVGFMAGEPIHVDVAGPNGYTAACDATAGDNGAWSCQVILWDSELAVGSYNYTATGRTSGVSQNGTFTDAASVSFLTSAFSVSTGTCSPVITVKTPGATSGAQINLTTSSSGGAFYSDSGCTTTITSVTTTSASDQKSFYYKDANAGNPIITGSITSPNSASATQTETIAPACTAPSTSNPASATKTVGESVTFSVTASGTAPLSYQWRKGGSPISGATGSSYTISSVVTADAGSYDVVVSNSCGGGSSVTSSAATLTVNKATATVTLGTLNFTYDGSPKSTTATTTPSGLSVNITYDGLATAPTNVGDYAVVATINDANYQGSASGTLHLNQASSTVTVTCTAGAPYTYTGLAQTPCTAQATGVGMGPVDVTASLVYSNNTNAGSATAQATWSGDTNHTGNTGNGGFTIGQASSTVTVTCTAGAPYTYTGSPQTPCTAQATGVGMTPVDVTGSLVYSNNTNAGSATAQATWGGDTNHTGNTGNGGFTIGQASSTVTVTCTTGAPYTYTGLAQTPCTAQATGVGMSPVDVTALLVYFNNANAGSATAQATWGGDTNHTGNTGNGGFTIAKANAVFVLNGYAVIYDGFAHTATGTATGVLGESLSGLDFSGTTHTNAIAAHSDSVIFTDVTGNYNDDATLTVTDSIAKANAVFALNGYAVTYDGFAHTATGTATGVLGESLSGLDFSGTTHTNAIAAHIDSVTFTDVTGNYNDDATLTVTDSIAKANAVFALNGYAVTYDGFAHTATGTATGVLGESLSGLDFSGTTHTNAIAAHTDSVIFTDVTGNYNDDATLTVTDSIAKANATIVVTPYSVVFDGAAHTATGSATGVLGESLGGLNLSGTTHTNPGDYLTDAWTFTDVTGNYNNANSTVHDNIHYATSGICYGGPGHSILQPINTDGSSVFKQKSTVPAKFRVCDANGISIGTPGVVSNFRLVQIISGLTTQEVELTVDSTTPDTAFRWSTSDQQWIFNINTKNLTAGKTYVYRITLNDGSTIDFQFGLK